MQIFPSAGRLGSFRLPARARGSALVIVLAFVVLLTSICLAVFIRARSESKISASSANQMKVSALADGAVNTILADLDAEIIAKSTATPVGSGATAGNLYIPKTPQDMVPERVGTSDTLPNLIKRSASGKLFFTGGADRAGNLPSDQPSQNGRFVSLARWNSHFLLPKKDLASDIDATPDASFIAPDWVLVTTDGSKVTVPDPKVVGRYAYAVYDEGGLLDLNVAGYPGQLVTDKKASQRGSLAFADLTQLTDDPSGAGGSQLLTQAQIDTIIGRRNFVSASIDTKTGDEAAVGGTFPTYTFTTQNAENYRRFGLFNPVNFLKTPRKNILAGDQKASDRLFLTRQEMISFLLNGVANGSAPDRAKLQNALQYFTQFTRDINQPSIIPPTGRPKTQAGTGNNSFKYDTSNEATSINPNFLKVRRTVALPATNAIDGVASEVGDLVVKKRFPLNRLAWLTFNGPIAPGGVLAGGVLQPLIDKYKDEGFTEEFLKQGTEANILKAFGLVWTTNPNKLDASGHKIWVYRGTAGDPKPKIALLSTIAAKNREADFFELLRASVRAGAMTRAATSGMPDAFHPLSIQSIRDESSLLATIQLGANIIDQFDPDSYPTEISIDDGDLLATPKTVSGVENLPYIYRVRTGLLLTEQAVPAAAAPSGAGGQTPIFSYSTTQIDNSTGSEPDPSNQSIRPNVAPEGKLTKTGAAGYLVMPDIWNPTDPNVATPVAGLGPTDFRVAFDSTDPDEIKLALDGTSVSTSSYNAYSALAWKNNQQMWSDQVSTAAGGVDYIPFSAGGPVNSGPNGNNFGGWARRLSEQNSVMTFTVPANDKSLFRDPTILFMAGVPTGSNLSLDKGIMVDAIVNSRYSTSFIGTNTGTAGVTLYGYKNVGQINPKLQPPIPGGSNTYVGIPLGWVPVRWVGNRPSNADKTVPSWVHSGLWASTVGGGGRTAPVTTPSPYLTVSLKYKAPDGKWVAYDHKYTVVGDTGPIIPHGTIQAGPITRNTAWTGWIDPRTSRMGPLAVAAYPSSVTTSSQPPPSMAITQWLDASKASVISNRPDSSPGTAATVTDWYNQKTGAWTLPSSSVHSGAFSQNLGAESYFDGDGILRPAMGGGASTGTLGLPMATGQKEARPQMLNRPFRSVGELGYVFSGNPWKDIDFANVQSGYSALLDLFCINDTADPTGLVAGKVNLNSRQTQVIKAIIAGAYKYEQDPTAAGANAPVNAALAQGIAAALTTRTGTKPLMNVGDLVGRWVSGTGAGAVYEGLSLDIFGDRVRSIPPTVTAGLTPSDTAISGFGESAIRSLASVGTTRVWNLMIDVIAQTGKYPPNSDKFMVEGEQRQWVHVAVDRFTGKILDMNMETVKE